MSAITALIHASRLAGDIGCDCNAMTPEVCAGVGVGEDGGLRLALRGSPTLRRWRLRCARGGGG